MQTDVNPHTDRRPHETSQQIAIVDRRSQDGAPHRRAVRGREDAAAIGRDPNAKPQGCPKRCQSDARRHAQKPKPERSGELAGERLGVVSRGDQRLGHDASVLGVVGDHAAAEQEAVPVGLAERPDSSPDPSRRRGTIPLRLRRPKRETQVDRTDTITPSGQKAPVPGERLGINPVTPITLYERLEEE